MADATKTSGETKTTHAKFTTGSTMRHVINMAATGAVGMIAIFMVDVANLFYISLLGEQALAAAVGYASTIMFFAVSVCIGFTIAATAITAKAIGKGDIELARKEATASLIFVFIAACIVTVLILANMDTMLGLIGATGETRKIAYDYMWIAVPSVPLLGIGMCTAGLLRANGDAKRAMYVTLSSGIAAAIIDPILIFQMDLGIQGAAIAIVIVRILFVIVGMHGTWIVHNMLAVPRPVEIAKVLKPFLVIGIPSLLTQIATPIGNAYVTRAIAEFGDDAVAGWAIIGRIIPLAFAATFSLSGAVGPILAQNYGAGLLDRVSQTMWDSLKFISVYVALMWALLAVSQGFIVEVFGASGDSEELIRTFCTYIAGLFSLTGILFVANAAFNNLGNPVLSTTFNWGRATIGIVPFVWVGQNWGPAGVMAGWSIGGGIFGLIAIIVCFRSLKTLPQRAQNEGIVVHHTPSIANSPFTSGRGAGL